MASSIPPQKFAVAVDIGGTKLAAATVDGEGGIHGLTRLRTEKESARASIGQIVRAIHQTLAAAGTSWNHIASVGLAVPGIYHAGTGKVWAPNLPGWDNIPLREELEAQLPVPIIVDSDRAACVLGEHWLGIARGLTDVVFLAVGTGIGAGIITGGKLCRGAGDIAGAVGWFALNPRWRELYRQAGCWEAEAAGPALARRAGTATAEDAVEAARNGSRQAAQALAETARFLAMGIANIISILNPQIVVLGGGLMQAGGVLLGPIRRQAPQWAQPISAGQARIELTALGGNAGLLGAARLALFGSP